MLIHSIISELDIFYTLENYQKDRNDMAVPVNVVPCITEPSALLIPQFKLKSTNIDKQTKP